MKKILLALLVMFGLQIQTQAQYCDSVELIVVSSTPTEFIIGTNLQSVGYGTIATYSWFYYDAIPGTAIPGSNGSYCTFCITDTLTQLNQTAIYSVRLGLNQYDQTLESCLIQDTLTYNVTTSEWELWSKIGNGNPTAITEIEINNVSDNRLYDLLGREFYNYNSIPPNTIYIKNRKKYLKTR